MIKLTEWIKACVAGILFAIAYNVLLLHVTIVDAFIKSLVVALEANLILLIYVKIAELTDV
jgi:hypothetical protein